MMANRLICKIIIAVTFMFVAMPMSLYPQTAYYWSDGRQINMTINNNKYFVVSEKTDTALVKNELQNALSISYFKPFLVGAVQNNATNTLNSKCWSIVETSSPISIPSNSSIEYMTPHFTLTDATTVGISNLFYVKLKNLSDTLKLDSLSNLYNVTRIGYYNRMPLWWTMECTKYSIGNSLEVANAFYESNLFDAAHPDIMCDIVPDCTNDYYFSSQWNLSNQDYSGIDINYCKARNITTGNANTIVAVYDLGIQANHPDLNNISTICYDIESGTNINVVYNNHGTWCAGVIGATANNNIGVAGIAPSSPIVPICYPGYGANPDAWTRRANGFFFALDNNVSVINCSWHVAENDIVRNAIERVINEGVVVVASASNRGVASLAFPASMANVIGVGAIVKNGTRYQYSNYGDSLNLVAPGVNIFTTDLNSGYYDSFDKTSAATPHVSGVAALMRSVNSNLTSAQVKMIIEQTAQRIRDVNEDPENGLYSYTESSDHPNGPWNDQMGYGLIDAHAAVMEAYFYDREILGNDIINPCNTTYPCNMAFTYNLNNSSKPNNTTVQWSVTGNLELISSNNYQANIRPTGNGTGIIRISYTHEGYTVTKEKQITIENFPTFNYYYCNYSTSGNMTFNNELYISGTFTVNSGHVVTISGVCLCFPDSKIIIQPGGKLIVDDGKLTSYCPGKMWNGIYVVGNSYQQQLAANQGTLEIKNNSLIENAEWGIITWNGYDYGTSGGIVKCSNSTFHNNGRAVEIYPYTNHDANNNECGNVSYLKNCNFTIDDNNIFASSNATYTYMIKMSAVNGISIRGCHFSDTRTGSPTRGTAIYLAGAGVNFKPSCSYGDYTINMPCICMGESRNTFSGFTKGISVQNPGSNYTINVFKTDFALCEQGIYTSAVNNYNVTMSNFNLSGVEFLTTLDGYGIYSNNCSGYKVEANNFYTTNTSHVFCNTCGIHMQNSGNNANTIYRNTFEKLDDGIKSINNPGLQVSCNEFSDNFTCDIGNLGSIPSQGTSSVSAGNQFSSGVSNFTSNIALYYYHSGAQLSSNPYYPASTSNNITKIPNITANECESTICIVPILPPIHPPINPKSSPASDDITLYESLQQEYDSRLAEYDAAGYGFLLENFDEEDADIVALARLKQDTLITIHRAMAEIANRNIDAILQDTLVFDREALNGWYNRINTQTAKYSLVNSYFEVGEYALARQELALIPQRFALTTDELAEYDNFCQYQSLRESVYASGRNYAQFTETEIAELQTIAERNTGVSSAYANSVLCFFYGICRDEELDLDFDIDAPMNSKSTTEVVEENAEPLAIYVYPNPADEELNILLNSLPEGRTTIEFHDVTGRLVLSEEIKGNSTSINISSLRQGVYMYRIVNGDNVIARDRIVKE